MGDDSVIGRSKIFAWVFLGGLLAGAIYALSLLYYASKPLTDNQDTTQQNSAVEESINNNNTTQQAQIVETLSNNHDTTVGPYTVLSVTDGDTIRIDYDGTSTPVRLIGVDTPETVDQRTTVQCFGQEASDYLKAKLTGKSVTIEADPTQSDRDKYDRLLRYVYLDGEDVGLSIISNGYGHEYTYYIPYQKQTAYKTAQKTAEAQNLGLWSPSTCNGNTTKPVTQTPDSAVKPTPAPTSTPTPAPTSQPTACIIKGNVNYRGEKIYHVPGQQYYDETVITPSKGERYFCTEEEAVAAGWRKSKV